MKLKNMFFKNQCPICNGKYYLKDGCHFFNDFHSYFYESFYINIVKFGIYEFMINNGHCSGESKLVIQFIYDKPDDYENNVKYNYVYSIRDVINQKTIFVDNLSEDFDFTDESVSVLIKKVLNNLIFI